MSATARAALLVGLLLSPTLAWAASPQPREWSPHSAPADITALAMAAEGGLIAAAQAPMTVTTTPGVGGIPTTPDPSQTFTDMVLASLEGGLLRHETTGVQSNPVPEQNRVTFGRSMVAVSRDGTAVASLGNASSGTTRVPTLFYARSADVAWSAPYYRNVTLAGTFAGLAISDDGRRVLAVMQTGTNVSLRGFAMESTLEPAFDLQVPAATARAVGADGGLTRMYLGGQFAEGNATYGGVVLYPFAHALPLASWYDRSANNSDVSAIAVARDANTVIASGQNGTLHVFRNARSTLPEPLAVALAETSSRLVVSEDGARAAAVSNKTLYALSLDATPAIAWNATLPGQTVTGLSINRTGTLVFASTSGSGGGVFGYAQEGGEPVIRFLGDARGVVVDAAGDNVAYAMRSALHAARLPRQIGLELVSGGKLSPTRTLTVPGSITYEVNVRNDGAAPEVIAFEGGASPEIRIESQPATLLLRPGAIEKVTLYVNSTPSLVGPRVFNVTARSLTSAAIDNVTLSVEPQPTLDVKLFANETEIVAMPNETSSVLVAILNNGTSDATVTVRASQQVSSGPAWGLTLPDTSFVAVRGTRTPVRVLMTPPPGVQNGTSSTVTLTLEGRDVFDEARISFRINPNLGVDVNATGVTKFIEPGKRASYNVTVTNTGSLPRQFEVIYEITSSSGRSWAVDMQQSTFGLDANAKRLIPLVVIAPSDAEPDDKATIRVVARSISGARNETIVTDNATLYAIAVAPRPTTTTPTSDVPALAPFAILAVAAVAARLLRRRQE